MASGDFFRGCDKRLSFGELVRETVLGGEKRFCFLW